MSSVMDGFLNPKGMVLFGSMKEDWFFGAGVVIKDLIDLKYQGEIYPVHPSAETVCGLKVRRDLSAVDGHIDLAVIVTSYKQVPGILKQCGQKGIRNAVVVSDGFGESGPEGAMRQEELLSIAKDYGIPSSPQYARRVQPGNQNHDHTLREGLQRSSQALSIITGWACTDRRRSCPLTMSDQDSHRPGQHDVDEVVLYTGDDLGTVDPLHMEHTTLIAL